MSTLRHLWQRYASAVLVLMALVAGLIWGLTLGRELGPAPPSPPSSGSGRGPAGGTSAPATAPPATAPPVATEQLIMPGSTLTFEMEPPPPGLTPPAVPHLSVRVDVRDGRTGRPVRADVWLTTITGDDSEDTLIKKQTSLVEVELPAPGAVDEVFIKVVAEGYYLWVIGVRHQVVYDRLLPLDVRLERIEGRG